MKMEQQIIEIYQQGFPGVVPTCFQQDMLFSTITDLGRWKSTVMFWAGNAYRPQSIAKMLEYYKELGNGAGKQYSKRSDQDVLSESADFYRSWQERDIAN